jgi:hypothetical protein
VTYLDKMKIIKIDKSKLPFENCKSIPTVQGIYFLWSDSELLYIGESSNINSRLRQHLGNSTYRNVNPKDISYISFEVINECKTAEDDLLNWLTTIHNWNALSNSFRPLFPPQDIVDKIRKVDL